MSNIVNISVKVVNVISITIAVSNTAVGISFANLTCQQINNGLSQTQRDELQGVKPVKSGQTTIFFPFDDGTTQNGRGVDFFTLDCNNSFGNTNRFTDTAGTQLYDGTGGSLNNIIIDHLTGLMWRRNFQGAADQDVAAATADAATSGGFTDWRLCNIKELMTVLNYASFNLMSYAPFNVTAVANQRVWTSTTRAPNLGITWRTQDTFIERFIITSNLVSMICRTHF